MCALKLCTNVTHFLFENVGLHNHITGIFCLLLREDVVIVAAIKVLHANKGFKYRQQ